MGLKMSSAKLRSFCLGLNVIIGVKVSKNRACVLFTGNGSFQHTYINCIAYYRNFTLIFGFPKQNGRGEA